MKNIKNVLSIAVLGVTIFAAGCTDLQYEKQESFSSPSGELTVTVKTDAMCRPDVYYGKDCIFEYNGAGFMEEVSWDIEWVSDDEIMLYLESPARDKYAGEKYSIEIPAS